MCVQVANREIMSLLVRDKSQVTILLIKLIMFMLKLKYNFDEFANGYDGRKKNLNLLYLICTNGGHYLNGEIETNR